MLHPIQVHPQPENAHRTPQSHARRYIIPQPQPTRKYSTPQKSRICHFKRFCACTLIGLHASHKKPPQSHREAHRGQHRHSFTHAGSDTAAALDALPQQRGEEQGGFLLKIVKISVRFSKWQRVKSSSNPGDSRKSQSR